MPIKEFSLLARDIGFYFSGRSDVAEANWRADPWLYPLDWSYQLDREDEYYSPKDADGVPMRNFGGAIGCQYLVSRIAGYGCAHWNRYHGPRGSASNLAVFIRTADWFLRFPDGRYEHHFPVSTMRVPWISCISQGEAASVLARAFVKTGKADYLDQARRSLSPLLIPVENGGLASRLPDGRPFLEEYPGTNSRHVLNGCLYAIVGMHDVIRAGGDTDGALSRLFDDLINSVSSNLQCWDDKGWAIYDFGPPSGGRRNLNTMTYQHLEVFFLGYLAEVTHDTRLKMMHATWQQSAGRLPMRLKALAKKLAYRFSAGW